MKGEPTAAGDSAPSYLDLYPEPDKPPKKVLDFSGLPPWNEIEWQAVKSRACGLQNFKLMAEYLREHQAPKWLSKRAFKMKVYSGYGYPEETLEGATKTSQKGPECLMTMFLI